MGYLIIHREGFGKASVYMLMIVAHILNLIFVLVILGDTPTGSALEKRQRNIRDDNPEINDNTITKEALERIHKGKGVNDWKVYTEKSMGFVILITFFMT